MSALSPLIRGIWPACLRARSCQVNRRRTREALPTLLIRRRSLPLTLPRRPPAAEVVANLRAAIRDLPGVRSGAASMPEAWGEIFAEHLPPDASLREQLVAIRDSLDRWARH